MEAGNPKQVALLGVIAVGAVGFLFTRMGGGAAPSSAAALTVARREGKARPTGALTIGRDPFSHPRLATKPEKPAAPEKGLGPPPGAKPASLIGAVPILGALPPATGFDAPTLAVVPAKESPAPKETETRTTIGLEAVVGASDAVAFLTVGGADSQPFRPKARVAGAIRLLRVGDGTVVLEGPKGRRVTLEVGDRKSL